MVVSFTMQATPESRKYRRRRRTSPGTGQWFRKCKAVFSARLLAQVKYEIYRIQLGGPTRIAYNIGIAWKNGIALSLPHEA